MVQRICFLIAHHHTYQSVDDIDYQILIEADFLVNMFEEKMSKEQIQIAKEKYFKTQTGKQLVMDLYERNTPFHLFSPLCYNNLATITKSKILVVDKNVLAFRCQEIVVQFILCYNIKRAATFSRSPFISFTNEISSRSHSCHNRSRCCCNCCRRNHPQQSRIKMMIMIQEQPPPNTLELHIMFSSLFVLYSILLRIPKRCYRIYLVSFQLHMIIKILLKQKEKLDIIRK